MRDSVHRRLPEARARAEAWPPDLQLPYGNRSALRAQGKRSEGRGPGVEGDAARAVEVVLDEGRARERGLGERHVLRSLPVHLVEGAVRAQALGLVRAHGEQRLPALGVPRVVRVIDRVGRLATKRRLANVEEEVGAVRPRLVRRLEALEYRELRGLLSLAHLGRLLLERCACAVHVLHLAVDALAPLLRRKVHRKLVALVRV
mmetsp:Transcript_16974/g.43458  ORF Transcript_16974/g.43458 Transcript_16974/m.43458 type:complete len:203 (-) Transcript_16974:458-1066(-)